MLHLFCSAATPLYKRDALESISYPDNHIFRYRYAEKYVDPIVLSDLKAFAGKEALLVFLDRVGSPASDFAFYPLRKVRILRLVAAAGAIYFNFRFGDFVNYGTNACKRDLWNNFFKQLGGRPWPPGQASDGYFAGYTSAELPQLTTDAARPFDNWNSVVNNLDQTADLRGSTFCLALGFYRVRRSLRPWRYIEKRLEPTHNEFDSIYPIPMGRSIVFKMLLSRPSFDYADPSSTRVLEITAAGDTFSGMSKNRILSESRYNEDRTVLVCKRVFDTALASVAIEESSTDVRSPQLHFLTRVRVPRLVVGAVVGGVALSALLLALDADVLSFLAGFMPPAWDSWFKEKAKGSASIAKLLAPVPIAVSAYIAFRRLPIK